ncbi:MAG: SMP-30/gluconolactonase/LRE family protein, partial [Candidatus Binatia bacterium]
RRAAISVLDGGLTPNDRLERTEPLPGPPLADADDLAIGADGALYVSAGREVLRLTGSDFGARENFAAVPGPAGALAFDRAGALLVAVDGVGLARVGRDRRCEIVLESVDGMPLRCLTGVVAASDGLVYLTDGSDRHPAEAWVFDLMERNSRGRLIEYDPATQRASVLAGGLAFPHGVTLDHREEALLFTEAWGHRVRRASLRATHEIDTLVGNLAGYPARIHPAPDGGYWLAVFALRTHLVEFVLTEDDFRAEMMRTIAPDYWIRPALRTLDSGLEPLQGGGIRKLGIVKPWAPPRSYGLVAKIDENGEARESLHSRAGGRHHGVTAARQSGGRLFVACKGAGRVLAAEITGRAR